MFIWSGKKGMERTGRGLLFVRQTDVLLGDCVSCMVLSVGFKALMYSLTLTLIRGFPLLKFSPVFFTFIFPSLVVTILLSHVFTLQTCMMPV